MPVGTAATVKGLYTGRAGRNWRGNHPPLTLPFIFAPGHELIRKLGGLHRFMSWRRQYYRFRRFQVLVCLQCAKIADEGVTFRSHLDWFRAFADTGEGCRDSVALGSDIADGAG